MPAFLRGFADHQPVTPVIETLRGLLLGTPLGAAPAIAAAWCAALGLAGIGACAIPFRRRTAR